MRPGYEASDPHSPCSPAGVAPTWLPVVSRVPGWVWTRLPVQRHLEGLTTRLSIASFPGLHAQLLSLAVRNAGEGLRRAWTDLLRAAADVMFGLLTSGFVLSPSLFFP